MRYVMEKDALLGTLNARCDTIAVHTGERTRVEFLRGDKLVCTLTLAAPWKPGDTLTLSGLDVLVPFELTP